jgi:two-component system cell cycle sensor histidine kinase/response regulator CckA
MDVTLAGSIDGIETARRLRAKRPISVVYLTGSTDDATLKRAKETSPHGYLKKPFNARELRIAVEIALHQHALEQALAARERWFSTTLRSIADAVLTTDRDGRVTFLNGAAEKLLGGAAKEALQRDVESVAGQAIAALARRAMDERAVQSLPADAKLDAIEIEGSIAPIVADEKAFGVVIVFRDVAEQRRLARRLGVTERLAAVGTMAAGMQHEINNPLATVIANVHYALETVRSQGSSDAELIAALEDADEAAERVRRTVADLRHIGGLDDEPAREEIDLASVVEDAAKLASHAVKHHATIRREHQPTPSVVGDRAQLTRVFVNLLHEAAQACGDGRAGQSVIILTTRTDDRGRAIAEVHTDVDIVAPGAIHRAFEPFVTGRPNASAGLRLAICHSIVTTLGGEIEAFAREGGGTTVRAILPAATSRSKPPSKRPGSTRRARVLVVDDEVAIGKAMRRMLARHHDVEVETDARRAKERLERETFDVVFCDLMMPEMSGMDLYEALAVSSPEIAQRMVFLTGGAFSPRSEEFLKTTRNACVAKPFTRETIFAVIGTLVS